MGAPPRRRTWEFAPVRWRWIVRHAINGKAAGQVRVADRGSPPSNCCRMVSGGTLSQEQATILRAEANSQARCVDGASYVLLISNALARARVAQDACGKSAI